MVAFFSSAENLYPIYCESIVKVFRKSKIQYVDNFDFPEKYKNARGETDKLIKEPYFNKVIQWIYQSTYELNQDRSQGKQVNYKYYEADENFKTYAEVMPKLFRYALDLECLLETIKYKLEKTQEEEPHTINEIRPYIEINILTDGFGDPDLDYHLTNAENLPDIIKYHDIVVKDINNIDKQIRNQENLKPDNGQAYNDILKQYNTEKQNFTTIDKQFPKNEKQLKNIKTMAEKIIAAQMDNDPAQEYFTIINEANNNPIIMNFINNVHQLFLSAEKLAGFEKQVNALRQQTGGSPFMVGGAPSNFVELIIKTPNDPDSPSHIIVPLGNVYEYSKLQPIRQIYKPNEAKLDESDLLETYNLDA